MKRIGVVVLFVCFAACAARNSSWNALRSQAPPSSSVVTTSSSTTAGQCFEIDTEFSPKPCYPDRERAVVEIEEAIPNLLLEDRALIARVKASVANRDLAAIRALKFTLARTGMADGIQLQFWVMVLIVAEVKLAHPECNAQTFWRKRSADRFTPYGRIVFWLPITIW